MRLFHRTYTANEILRNGFRDGHGTYMSDAILTGVWLSNVPLDVPEGAADDQVLEVDLPEAVAVYMRPSRKARPFREFPYSSSDRLGAQSS